MVVMVIRLVMVATIILVMVVVTVAYAMKETAVP